ncbi:MAG: hypothetical protein CMD16_01075 [Flavobacteriales bacterium]|nr:hypothetical protein [Flavobacteriales bacterium]|tara:strand:- start:5020 stop:5529 length:510 start_codon:yes stop_codon:yes gene_type:complete
MAKPKNIFMKKMSLLLAIISSISLFSQEIITKEIFTLQTKEKNSKTILFSSQERSQDFYYIIKAKNETSKDFSKCKWLSRLSVGDFMYFLDALASIEEGSTFECSLFLLKYKNNKLNIKFNKTKCTSEHKTHYFQKSCNRSLNFVLYESQIKDIINKLQENLDNHLVKK